MRLRLLLEVEFESFPYNWSMEDSVVWTIVENCCGVISICLPTLRPIMRVMPWKSIQNAFTRSYGATGASRSGTNMGNSAFNHPSRQGYWSEIRSTNDGSVGPSGIQKDTQVDVVSIEMHPTRDSSPGRFGGSTV